MPPRTASSAAWMDETRRLELIAEAVRYCQLVKEKGMPPSCYSKALREPIYFLWECRDGRSKASRPQYRSKSAVGVRFGKGELVYDHAVPFRYLQEELLALHEPTVTDVASVLNRHGVVVLITKEENALLNRAGLGSRMPEDWNGRDPLARYRAVGIVVDTNTTN